jgi:hypothetical protein
MLRFANRTRLADSDGSPSSPIGWRARNAVEAVDLGADGSRGASAKPGPLSLAG